MRQWIGRRLGEVWLCALTLCALGIISLVLHRAER